MINKPFYVIFAFKILEFGLELVFCHQEKKKKKKNLRKLVRTINNDISYFV